MLSQNYKEHEKVLEIRNRDISFLSKQPDEKNKPRRGYSSLNSENFVTLKKIIKLENTKYNSYVSIATYSEVPKISLNPKLHWVEWRKWLETNDETATKCDFFLDFDGEATIEGLKEAWEDVKIAKEMLPDLIGEQAKYLTTWFSGNKGFHILGKCKIGGTWGNTAQEIINKQKDIAMQMELLCPSIDTSIYDTARLRKLLGSYVYTKQFGKTRVIPICDEHEKDELQIALATKNTNWFEEKPLIRINNIKYEVEK